MAGWLFQRDARDLSLPVFETSEVPDSGRLVTATHTLRFVDAESVARILRSFMPANSRIIPAPRSQLFITDTGSNIRKLRVMLARIDTPEGAKRLSEYQPLYPSGPPHACGEQWIEKLVVEKLEIQDSGSTNGNGNWQSLQTKSQPQGAKK